MLGLIGVVVAAALLWLAVRSLGEPSPGPLGSADASSLGIGRLAGVDFAYGLPVVINSGDEPAVLERIELVDPTPGLRVVETLIAGPGRRVFGTASTHNWPDDRNRITDLHEVRGFEVQPQHVARWDRGAELVFVLRADEPGRYLFNAVAVNYRVGDDEHRTVVENGLGVCVTLRKPYKRGCEPAPGLEES